MAEPAMELTDVKKTIGNKEIIKGLSFTINRGEVFGFIGPNGAGKTTTIRMMVGLMNITEGDIRILGNSIKDNHKAAIREVGAIVENPEMYPFMSGWQNLKHYARMIPGITKERITEVVQLVGLEKPIKEKAGRYSLGMRQRLGIAQALLHNPSVLILDEPTNGLDPAGIREIRKYIRNLAQTENVAVIVSSHMLAEVEQMCDRIGIIKNGELISTQHLHETSEEQGHQIQMEVDPLNKALELLRMHHDVDGKIVGDVITFQGDKKKIPKYIQTLVENELSIYQVGVSKATLEDKFFDLIGENTIE
ncbi:bacitracin ABC transporter ATP-binding protein [Virgibacillus phasianinus]|uniref:Bacitracin ABC transporter ATP-binding protein n=1 Tax=Virgibacillus phasianinus TaxID=2017483 RepID=A0A220U085_9BACI|nr:ABC transporter ATP-binding protein [Virgibacillus phasianinus]ASK61281.1 bacitracin ABC transporter ATP-binding protein [Virgibacillus phasianinus]